MKRLLTFLLISTCLNGVAQDPRLLETTWYLTSLKIDNQNYQPPSNNEVPFIALDFTPKPEFSTNVCDILSGTVSYFDLQFTFISYEITQLGCVDSENGDYQNFYLNHFFEDNISNPFNYVVIEHQGDMDLIISSDNGDQAFYRNKLLTNSDNKLNEFNVFPNPSNNTLNLPNTIVLNDLLNTTVYDLNGRPIIELEGGLADKSIDISNLQEGFYILKLTTKNGQLKVAKFIKL